MKSWSSLLAALAVTIPALAGAQVPADYYTPNDKAFFSDLEVLSGIAKVSGPAEAPYVELIGDKDVVIAGPLAREMVAHGDTEVRVRGNAVVPAKSGQPTYVYGESFAPLAAFPAGAGDVPVDFITGVVEYGPIPANVRIVPPPIQIRTHSGMVYTVTDEPTRTLLGGSDQTIRYSGAIGATVTLFGKLGDTTHTGFQNFETRANQMLAKGRIRPLFHILGFESHEEMTKCEPDECARRVAGASAQGAAAMIAPFPDHEFPTWALTLPSGEYLPLYTSEPTADLTLGRGEARWVTFNVERAATPDGVTKLRVKVFSGEVEPPSTEGLQPLTPPGETVPDADPFRRDIGVGGTQGTNTGRFESPATVQALTADGDEQVAPSRQAD